MIEGQNSVSSPIEVVMNEKKLVRSDRFHSIKKEEKAHEKKVRDAVQHPISYISSEP